MLTTNSQATFYNNQGKCLGAAVAFYMTKPEHSPAPVNESQAARAQRIAMAGPATDATSDYLGNHLHRLSATEIQNEIDALDAQIAVLSPMDYAWAEATLYDLQGVRMVLEDALLKVGQ